MDERIAIAMDRLPPDLIGLSADEVRERVAQGRTNAAAAPSSKSVAAICLENVFSVFNAIIAAIIAFFLFFYAIHGDARLLLDCVGVGLVAVFNTVIAVVQEIKAKRALDAVRLLLARTVTVVRDLRTVEIAPERIVLGDVVHLARGDQAVVDGVMLATHHLEMDESLLTGESEPVRKAEGDAILSGSFCLAGSGYFKATAVGDAVYAAKVAHIAKRYKFEPTPLTRRIDTLVKGLFAAAVILIGLSLARNAGAPLGVDFVRAMGAILIGLVPQGLVLMSSVTFALGVYRISRVGAVVQKLTAIESFSAATVICMDKTGTITQNRLTVKAVTPLAEGLSQAGAEALLGTYAALGSEKNATATALSVFAPARDAVVVDEIPFSSARKMGFLEIKRSGERAIWALGGFDLMLARLHETDQAAARRAFDESGLSVFRTLMLVAVSPDTALESIRSGESFEASALCLVAIGDTVRPDAGAVIRDFEAMGKRFKILSGDAASAIAAVCRDIGWEIGASESASGEELDALDEAGFAAACRDKKVFARLSPEHKLRIVRELKRAGEHTVMLGDGVNDLPAIKEANLGMAMEEGSQATKEVADVVLLANRFTLLPEILAEGNRIVNSVAAVAKLFLTKNFLVICATLLTLGFGLDFPLTPRRVSLLNIFAIGLPAMLIALRNTNTAAYRGFLADATSFAFVSALVMTAGSQAALYLTRSLGGDAAAGAGEMAMLAAMVVLASVNFVLVAVENRSERLRGETFYAVGMAMVFTALCLMPDGFTPIRWLKLFYEIAPLSSAGWAAVAIAGIGGGLVLAGMQRWRANLLGKTI